MQLSDPISTTLTCEWTSTIQTSTDLTVATVDQSTINGTTGNVDLTSAFTMTLESSGTAQSTFDIGETIDVSVAVPGVVAAANAQVKLHSCVVFEDLTNNVNPLTLMKSSTCGLTALNAVSTDEFNFSFRIGSSNFN